MRKLRYLHAVREGIFQEMKRNKDIVILGEDVRHSLRGITKGMVDEFGSERIMDTPLSEIALVGAGTGLALNGLRPIVEFQLPQFVFLAFDQIVNQAQKIRYMSGGKMQVPVTYLIPGMGGPGVGLAGQHSDTTYNYLIQAGMKLAIPSTSYDAKGMVITAIRENDPVAVYMPAKCLSKKGEVPEDLYDIPLGKGIIRKYGNDITIIAIGHLVEIAIEAAEEVGKNGIFIEVLDPRTLLPLDRELIMESVSKTGRVIIFDDSNITCGIAAEISALIAEEIFDKIKAPIRRLCRADVPVPFSATMERYVMPDKERLVSIINEFSL